MPYPDARQSAASVQWRVCADETEVGMVLNFKVQALAGRQIGQADTRHAACHGPVAGIVVGQVSQAAIRQNFFNCGFYMLDLLDLLGEKHVKPPKIRLKVQL